MNILSIDQNLLVKANSLVNQNWFLDKALTVGGIYFVYLVPVVFIICWFTYRKYQFEIALALLSGLFSWFVLTKLIISHIWFRPRPDVGIVGLKEIFFHRPDYSFPSDHVSMLAGIAFALYFAKLTKAANYVLIATIIVAICRVIIGVHFPLDVAAGLGVGALGAYIIHVLRKPIKKYIFDPIIPMIRKIKLA
ncbi:hypothetical protein COT77_02975 [Candidatus Berkelbacteria bacterium CG10_big_fil_rev_8_21_14_0_10_41_12]|uniref:Phosphatidic acid phosphatase type 2/haloperoxidase domain-containing protein n=1 Tax=Candidatus Berkelbacteria bacterium CG10_big_fil_rev_8_21_14_0_10_41_12 TaxID=1974513 RepID=A0A2M6WWQ9_9BACT|nr:MAG: hypothetical protein COT77_02975 [Candidatus Berkelbacteria bacterium CG10_big_fil_rev_8_21_14_0_10_41_12]